MSLVEPEGAQDRQSANDATSISEPVSESTQRAWDRGQELKTKLRALVQNGAAVVREIDAKQGGLLTLGVDDDSSDGCTVIALMAYSLLLHGLFTCSNFASVIEFWSGPLLKDIRTHLGGMARFVEPEPAFDKLRSLGLIPPQVTALLRRCIFSPVLVVVLIQMIAGCS